MNKYFYDPSDSREVANNMNAIKFHQGALGRLGGGCFATSDKIEKYTPTDVEFRREFERRFSTLSFDFVQGMNEIGNYGLDKYGSQSMEAKFKRGDFSRSERTKTRELLRHASVHGEEFTDGILHDKFGTLEHQLFAGGFNFMMEYRFRSKK